MKTQTPSLFGNDHLSDGILVRNDAMPPAQMHSEPSKAAAKEMQGEKADRARAKVLEALRFVGAEGLTDKEIEWATDLSGSCVRPRRIELVEAGAVKDSGTKRCTGSKIAATVWVVVEAGK